MNELEEPTTLQPRPSMLQVVNIPLPDGETIQNFQPFRTKRRWWQIWKPKYAVKYYAFTQRAVYDVTEFVEPPK